DISNAGGGAGNGGEPNNSSGDNNKGGFWKFWETGGMFQVWGVMKDMPGYKANSRKRSAVDVSMNYDEAYERGAGGSLRKGKNFLERLENWLGGMDDRSGLVDKLNETETKSETEKEDLNTMDSLYPTKKEVVGYGAVLYHQIDSMKVKVSPNSQNGKVIESH